MRPARKRVLAIDGGPRVRERLLPYGTQTISDDDVAAVSDALRQEYLTRGPRVDRFEEALARVTGARHAIAFSSGTAALHAAARAAGLAPGKTLGVPSLTFVGSANAARFEGAGVRLLDIDPATLGLDPRAVAAAGRLDAVMPVHFGGLPCGTAALAAAADGAPVIEDACHALGSREDGALVGSCRHSAMACFSFHPVKAITTLEGGAVTTASDELAGILRRFRDHGFERRPDHLPDEGPWYFEMVELGYNYRMSDVQAALGLSQLTRLEEFLVRREAIAAWYRRELGPSDLFELPPAPGPGSRHAYHLFPIRLRLDRLGVDRRRVFEALRAEGIGVQVHYIPVHRHPYYRSLGVPGDEGLPETARYYRECLTLPVFPAMGDADLRDVQQALAKVLEAYRRG